MSQAQKDAMAQGRRESRAVRTYLDALQREQKRSSRRGPKMTEEKLRDRISDTERRIAEEPNPQARLELIQSRLDDEQQLAELVEESQQDSAEDLEAGFTEVAATYSERKGISYKAWRELGVPAKVLKAAGVSRAS